MSTSTMDVRCAVNRLIEVCHYGQQGCAVVAESLQADDALLKFELSQYSRQLAEIAAELESELVRLGGIGADRPYFERSTDHQDVNLKPALPACQRAAILAEYERVEEMTLAAVRETLCMAIPMQGLVSMQNEAIRRIHNRLWMWRAPSSDANC